MVLSVTIKLSFSCIFEFIELVEGLNCLSRLCHPSDCMTPYTSLSSRSTDSGSHFTALRTTLALTPRLKKPMSNWYCGFKHFLGQIRRMRYAYKVARIFQYEFHDVIFCSIGSASEVVWAGRRFRTKFVVGVVWHCPASGAPIPVLCRSVTLCGKSLTASLWPGWEGRKRKRGEEKLVRLQDAEETGDLFCKGKLTSY